MRSTRLMLAVAVLIAIGAALAVGSFSETTEAKKNKSPEVSFEFSTTYTGPQFATEIVALTLCAANIGSSGLDGISAPRCTNPDGTPASSDWQIDSFFDVTYRVEIFGDPDFDVRDPDAPVDDVKTVDIELIALSLTSADPVEVLDRVDETLDVAPGLKKHKHRGHVTILK